MKKRKDYILLFLIGLLYSCSQESLPDPSSGTPVFTASGTFGNNPINIKAGNNDFYMFSEFSKDDENVFTFSGTFAKLEPDCDSTCNEKLRVSIRDFQMTDSDFVSNINSSLFAGKYEYDNGIQEPIEVTTITSYNVDFINNTVFSFGEHEYIWRFSPLNQDSFEIMSSGPNSVPETQNFTRLDFPVTLEGLDFEQFITCKEYSRTLDALEMNCSSALGVTVEDSSSANPDILSANIQDVIDLDSSVWVWIDSLDIPISMESGIGINESGEFCVQSFYNNGCINETCIRTNIPNVEEVNYCSVSFDYRVEPQFETTTILPDNPFRLSEIVVEYVNENGLIYRSDLGLQLDESEFTILEVTDFEANEKGEKTKQLKIQFDCVLYAENDESINFENAEVVIAVAYPSE